jgi:hypothetical protein
MRIRTARLHDEAGMSMVFISVGFLAFFAATTLAVDVGMFMTARTQAQNSADAAALSGATALVYDDWDDRSPSGPAVQSAMHTGLANKVMGQTVDVVSTDVTFPLDTYGQANLVKVGVFRTATRDNPVATLVGPVFGVPTVDIIATATAQAAPADGMTCVKPFIVPDKWIERQDAQWTTTSTFTRYDNKGKLLANPDEYDPAKGYGAGDVGTLLILRAQQGNNIAPSMYYSWKMPGEIGGSFYEDNIANCNPTVIGKGYVAQQEPGAMEGPTLSGLERLLARDPGAYWDDDAKKYVSTQNPSPRVFPIPLYDPDWYEQNKQTGRTATLVVKNWLGFFLEDIKGGDVYGRVFPIAGVTAAAGPTTGTPLAFVIRLVQ